MKNSKKLMACLLSIAMLPAVVTKWQSKAEASTPVFVEDFEDYEVGTLAVGTVSGGTSSGTVGVFDYELRYGDKIEVAEDGNGNKYLKITRTDTGNNRLAVKYNFPDTYSNKKFSVSYDIKPDVHNKYFAQFGSLLKDDNGVHASVNFQTISYKNNVYAYKNSNANYYIGGLLDSSRYTTDSDYATITQTVDFTKASNNYEFTAVYPNGSGGTTTTTKTNTATGTGFYGLFWSVYKNTTDSAANGLDDASVAAVYRIDNIIVEEEVPTLNLSSTNVANNGEIEEDTPFIMTFNNTVDTANVTLEKDGVAMAGGDYTVTVSGSTVSVIPTAGWINGSEYTVNVGQVTTTTSGYDQYLGTTFTLTGSSYLFVEDFEDWTVGTIVTSETNQSSESTTSEGRIKYQLQAGDKIAIAQDETGNKYLEITRTSTSTTRLGCKYIFPQTYSNKKYSVSYNFMTEEHNQYFEQFGSLLRDTNGTQSGVNAKITSYNKSIYFADNSTNPAGQNILNPSKYTDSTYATITQTIDFTSLSDTSLIGVLPDGTSGISQPAKRTAQGTGFFGLFWNVHIHTAGASNTYNGSTDHTNPSVYRIDNIKVKAIPQRYLSADVADNAQDVATNTAVTLTFAEPVASASGIKVTQNGIDLVKDTDYTVAVSSKTVTITPSSSWRQGAEVVVSGTVTGTNTDIGYTGKMLTFYTTGDYILSNVRLSGNTIMANLLNATAEDIECIAIGTQLDGNGDLSFFNYTPITVESGKTESISIEFTSSAPFYNLYIWDNFEDINALTGKRTLNGS